MSATLSAWDEIEWIEEIHQLKSQADDLFQKGHLFAARTNYMLARLMMGDNNTDDETYRSVAPFSSCHQRLSSGLEPVYVDLSLSLERVSSMLGLERESQAIKEATWSFVFGGCLWDYSRTEEEKVTTILRCVDEMNKHCDFNPAGHMLHLVSKIVPSQYRSPEETTGIPTNSF